MAGLRLYDYAASGNCYKARLLLEQLEQPYERIPVDIFAGETLTDEFAAVNPARTVPVLETGDGRLLPESSAILLYLGEGTGFLPRDRFDRAQVVRWLIYEQTDVIPMTGGLRFRLQTGRIEPGSEAAKQRYEGGLEVLGLLDGHLAERRFFAADAYSIADVSMYSYLHVAHEAGFGMDAFPHVQRWLESVREQPGYMSDLEPYPPNAHAGRSRSLYD